MTISTLRRIRLAVLAAGQLTLFTTALLAQSAPPIPGATGVVKPENNPDGATPAIGAATGKVVRAVKGALGKNGKPADVDPLRALALGTKVAMRPGDAALRATAAGRGEDKTTEGTVIDINRSTAVIVIRLADRTTEKLRLDEPSKDANRDASASKEVSDKVTVSYVDTNGTKAEQVFRKVS